jgi:hypothetical protein
MKASLLIVAFVLGLATPSFANFGSAVKVYIFAAAEETDTFHVIPRMLADSAKDLRPAIHAGIPRNGLAVTSKRDTAAIVAQVTSREELQGEYRVHVHVTTIDGHEADLTGISTHQWKQSADDVVQQLADWARAHRSDLI